MATAVSPVMSRLASTEAAAVRLAGEARAPPSGHDGRRPIVG